MQRESHWQYMKRRMREDTDKQGICPVMSPWEAARRIRAMDQRIIELENAVAELCGRQPENNNKD
jgi:hypothetical protein